MADSGDILTTNSGEKYAVVQRAKGGYLGVHIAGPKFRKRISTFVPFTDVASSRPRKTPSNPRPAASDPNRVVRASLPRGRQRPSSGDDCPQCGDSGFDGGHCYRCGYSDMQEGFKTWLENYGSLSWYVLFDLKANTYGFRADGENKDIPAKQRHSCEGLQG